MSYHPLFVTPPPGIPSFSIGLQMACTSRTPLDSKTPASTKSVLGLRWPARAHHASAPGGHRSGTRAAPLPGAEVTSRAPPTVVLPERAHETHLAWLARRLLPPCHRTGWSQDEAGA